MDFGAGEILKMFRELGTRLEKNMGLWWIVLLAFLLVSIPRFDAFGIVSLLELNEAVERYRDALSAAVWVTGGALGVGVLRLVWIQFSGIVRGAYDRRRKKLQENQKKRELLHNLNPEQKAILLLYFLRDTTTQPLPYRNPRLVDLERKEIIYQTDPYASPLRSYRRREGGTLEYTLSPWAREYLDQMDNAAVDDFFEGSLEDFLVRHLASEPDVFAEFLKSKGVKEEE